MGTSPGAHAPRAPPRANMPTTATIHASSAATRSFFCWLEAATCRASRDSQVPRAVEPHHRLDACPDTGRERARDKEASTSHGRHCHFDRK